MGKSNRGVYAGGKKTTTTTTSTSTTTTTSTSTTSTTTTTTTPSGQPYSTFTLAAPAKVSIGVYDGETKVRDLFSEQDYPAGTHVIEWDGKDDFEQPIANPYQKEFKVSYGNPVATWEGGKIGNTSTQLSNTIVDGSEIHNGYYGSGLTVIEVNGMCYYITGYGEGTCPFKKFAVNDPQRMIYANLKDGTKYGESNWNDNYYICSDGQRIYMTAEVWYGATDDQPHNMNVGLLAYDIAADKFYTFNTTHLTVTNEAGSYTNPTGNSTKYPAGTLVAMEQLKYSNFTFGSSINWSFNPDDPYRHVDVSGNTTITVTGAVEGDSGVLRIKKTVSTHGVTLSGSMPPFYMTVNGVKTNVNVIQENTNNQLLYFKVEGGVVTWYRQDLSSAWGSTTATGYNQVGFGPGSPRSYAKLNFKGIAVSNTHVYLAQAKRNRIYVVNKLNGLTTRTIKTYFTDGTKSTSLPFNTPRAMHFDTTDGANGALWITHSASTVQKFYVQADGSLVQDVILTGLGDPSSVFVANGLVHIADGGENHNIRRYNKTTGAFVSFFGTQGGHKVDARVIDNRFYFDDIDRINGYGVGRVAIKGSVTVNADGSMWVCDTGNNRMLKFNAAGTKLIEIQNQGATYYPRICEGDNTRIIEAGRVFQVDYSKPLHPGGWKLTHNYLGMMKVDGSYNTHHQMSFAKLANGRYYIMMRSGENCYRTVDGKLKKLQDSSIMIELGDTYFREVPGLHFHLVSRQSVNGDIYEQVTSGNNRQVYLNTVTGFDAEQNPIYSRQHIATYTPDPVKGPDRAGFVYNKLENGDIAIFNNNAVTDVQTLPHQFRIAKFRPNPASPNTISPFIWKGCITNFREYRGDYPFKENMGEIGNGTNYAFGMGYAAGNFVFWNHHGEFWKQGQTNMYHILDTNGLQVHSFGTAQGATNRGAKGQPETAGNTLTIGVTKVGSTYYLYGGDESNHAAIHRWKIEGLDDIQTMTIPAKPYIAPKPYTDLMEGIQRKQWPFPATQARWTRFPDTDQSGDNNIWKVATNSRGYKLTAPDIATNNTYRAANAYIQCDMDTVTTSDWKVEMLIQSNGNPPFSTAFGWYIDVLDASDRVIARFQTKYELPYNLPNYGHFFGNGSEIGPRVTRDEHSSIIRKKQLLTFEVHGLNSISFTFNGNTLSGKTVFTTGANWQGPKKIKITHFTNPTNPNYDTGISVHEARFYNLAQ